MKLSDNQSALILEADEKGEITVDVASGDIDGNSSKKLTILYGNQIQ